MHWATDKKITKKETLLNFTSITLSLLRLHYVITVEDIRNEEIMASM